MLLQLGACAEHRLRQRVELINGGSVDTYETPIVDAFDAAADAGRISGEDTNALRLGGHEHLRHVVAYFDRVSAA